MKRILRIFHAVVLLKFCLGLICFEALYGLSRPYKYFPNVLIHERYCSFGKMKWLNSYAMIDRKYISIVGTSYCKNTPLLELVLMIGFL